MNGPFARCSLTGILSRFIVSSMRDWLSWSHHQLALGVWCGGLICLSALATSPRGLAAMPSMQGALLWAFILSAGPIGWGLVKRVAPAKWILVALLICQALLWLRQVAIHPNLRSAGLLLATGWIIFELIRWDITGRIESGRRYLQQLKYVKHKSRPKSFWSSLGSARAPATDPSARSDGDLSVPSERSSPKLIMDRFCGREVYPIETAEWHFYDRGSLPKTFHLRVEAGPGITLRGDTEELRQEPFWTVSIVDPGLTIDSFVPGARFLVPKGYDESRQDHVTNFFYGTHEVSDQNSIEILQAEGDRFLIRMEGQIADVNYYGSKPPSRVSLQTWFIEGS